MFATVAVSVSVFVFAYSTLYGFVSILIFYSLWLPLIVLDYRKVLGNYARFYWIFAFALLACMSFAWSAAPSLTLRGGIQYATTVTCALIASRIVDARTFVRGISIGVAVVLIYSLAFGQFEYDELDGSYSFAGAFSSKNQLGFFASLGIIFCFQQFLYFADKQGLAHDVIDIWVSRRLLSRCLQFSYFDCGDNCNDSD